MRASNSTIPALLAALLLAACTGTKVVRGEGQTIAQAQAEKFDGPKYRIAVGSIIDKTDPSTEKSLARQIGYVNAKRKADEQIEARGITSGIHDVLVTELFNSGQFIVLERDALNDVLVEQEFAQSAKVGDESRIPLKQLEGAELLVVGALTGFDAGVSGVAIPIPIPLGKDFSKGIGIANLSFKRGFAAMDIRVIDTATGRIVASTAVEGRNTSYGLGLEGLFTSRIGYIPLPGLLNVFSNTPVEQALQKMVTAAIGTITKQRPSKRATTALGEAAVVPATASAATAPPPKPAAPKPLPAAPKSAASPAAAPAK